METGLETEGNRELDGSGAEVALGTHVEVELIAESGENEYLAFEIVPDAQADLASGFLGEGTPLAQAILSQCAGTVVYYQMGDIVQVRVLAVGEGMRAGDGDAATDRQAIIRRAISKSDLAESVRFALTVDQKWGETDPEGIVSNWEETPGEGEPRSK